MKTGYVIILPLIRRISLECTLWFGNKKMALKCRYEYVTILFSMTENTEIDITLTMTRGRKIGDFGTLPTFPPWFMVPIRFTEYGATYMYRNQKNYSGNFATATKNSKKWSWKIWKKNFKMVNSEGKNWKRGLKKIITLVQTFRLDTSQKLVQNFTYRLRNIYFKMPLISRAERYLWWAGRHQLHRSKNRPNFPHLKY